MHRIARVIALLLFPTSAEPAAAGELPAARPARRIRFDSTHQSCRTIYVIDPRAWLEAWGRES